MGGVHGYGTVFRTTPSGALTTLYSFCSCGDGANPNALAQAANGDFYGTTSGEGPGTVFKITPNGTLTTLHSFCSQSNCADGFGPDGALVQATNGDLYGTTAGGGGPIGAGTVFKITPAGALTTLYSFCPQGPPCTGGSSPYAGLVQGTDGNFYGTTSGGGAYGGGTVFEITPSGTLTMLYSFCSQTGCTDGSVPYAGLVQGTDGNFYGTTTGFGEAGTYGTVFSLNAGLGPFVETQPTAGPVGATAKILGTNLTGATSVSFNGTAAVFTVVSPSLITTIVPAGATTGTVQVVTPNAPNGTLSSDVPFRVP